MTPFRRLVPLLAPVLVALAPARALAADDVPALTPTQLDFLQYGAAIVTELRVAQQGICPQDATAPCILGNGGGLGLRVAHRSHEGWLFGGAYEFSKQDSSNILNLPILQQLRAEARYYLVHGSRLSPYLIAGAGGAAYGNQWSVDTWGFVVTGGLGIEYESTREVFVGLAPCYRAVHLGSWQDAAGQYRPGGLAHFIAIELTLEVRSPFARW